MSLKWHDVLYLYTINGGQYQVFWMWTFVAYRSSLYLPLYKKNLQQTAHIYVVRVMTSVTILSYIFCSFKQLQSGPVSGSKMLEMPEIVSVLAVLNT